MLLLSLAQHTKHKDCCTDFSQHPNCITHGKTSLIITMISAETIAMYIYGTGPQHNDMQ